MQHIVCHLSEKGVNICVDVQWFARRAAQVIKNTLLAIPSPESLLPVFVLWMFMSNFANLELFSKARKVLDIECRLCIL